MKKIIIAAALTVFATGAYAHDIEVSVTKFQTKNNIALGFSAGGGASGPLGGSTSGSMDAATAYAGSIGVDASCGCTMDVEVTKVRTKNNLALGDASAGSITVRSGGGKMPY